MHASTSARTIVWSAADVPLDEDRTPAGLLRQVGLNLAHLESAVPSVEGVADELIDHFERRANEAPNDPQRQAHRAFRPAQVVVHTSGVGFIHFDQAGNGRMNHRCTLLASSSSATTPRDALLPAQAR